jgi:hypothetical protein
MGAAIGRSASSSLGFTLVVFVAACGSTSSGVDQIERDVKAGRTANVRVTGATSVSCRHYKDAKFGGRPITIYDCIARSATGRHWLTCDTGFGRGTFCVEDETPPGMAFTTAEEKAAPKLVTWQCENQDNLGRRVGRVFISIRGAPSNAPVDTLPDWTTKADARAFARKIDASFSIEC